MGPNAIVRCIPPTAGEFLTLGVVTLLLAGSCFAQSGNGVVNVAAVTPSSDLSGSTEPASSTPAPKIDTAHPAATQSDSIASRMAAGITISTLGIGGQFAVRVIKRGNVRIGFNDFSLSHTFNDNGITYGGKVGLRSFQGTFDYFLLGPLHVSAGGLLYNGDKVTANLSVPSGQTFTLGSTTYQSAATSSSTQPIAGAGTLNFNKAAPLILLGVGNPIGRHHHYQFWNFEIGVAYQGSPRTVFNLSGWACTPPNTSGSTCVNAAVDPNVQSNIAAQQAKLNKNISAFKFYPVISSGLYFRF